MWSDDKIQFKMKFIEGDFFTTQNDEGRGPKKITFLVVFYY